MKITRAVRYLSFCCSLILLLGPANCVRPVILSEPGDVTVSQSSFTVLCIKSTGSEVEWYRKGALLDTARDPDLQVTGDGSLHVKNAQRQRDEGRYNCLVLRGRQSVISRNAEVKFAYLNPFSERSQIVEESQDNLVVLRCNPPDSFPHRTIQWSKRTAGGQQPLAQSSHYAVSQEGDLHFAYLDREDAGEYVCTVTNLFIMKEVAKTISLRSLPVDTSYDMSPKVAKEFEMPRTALKGEEFVLECIAYGKPVPRITLRKRGLHMTLGSTRGNIKRLVIKSFNQDDAGRYKCRASDHRGKNDTKSTIVTMEAKPEWITKPRDTTAGSNMTTTLPCVAFGIPSVQYTWYFNGKPMVWTERHIFHDGNLTIKALSPADMGIYQCFVSNKHGQMHADIELNVSEIPAGFGIGSRPPQTNQKALVRSSVEFTCRPTGEPKPAIRWLFGAMQLEGTGRYRILPNGNLVIRNVTRTDSGEYTCEARNKLGRARRKGFLSVVDYIVVTENMPQEASVILGRDTRFMCGVTTLNSLEVTFQWSKYFAPLKSNRHVRISRTDDKNKVSRISVQRGYLEINKAKYSDEGLYSCEAIGNSKMIVRKDVYLKVQGPPGPPTDVDIHFIVNKGESINVTWVLGKRNNSPIRKVIIQYITQFSPKSWQTIAEEARPEQGWTQIALSPWLRYTFRAIAVNDIGNSTPSAHSPSFQAPASAPTMYPPNVRGEGTSPAALTISWEPLKPINHNGPGLYYIVYYQKADNQGKPVRKEVKRVSTYSVLGVDYYTQFTIQLQAANDIGFGPKSPVVFAYSGEQVPIGAPRDLAIRITSATSAYATWTGVPDTRETIRGKLLGYKVYFWGVPSGQVPHKAVYKATIDTSTTLHLEAYTSYRFQVVAYNSKGDGPASNVVGPLTTPAAIPSAPRSLSLHIQNKSFILLQWKAPEHVNGIITDYQVTAQRLPALHMVITGQTNGGTTEIRFPYLEPEAAYRVSVLAANRMGTGPPAVVTFDLSTAPSVPPYNVTADFDDINKVATLYWKSSLTDIEGFRIFHKRGSEKVKTVDVDKLRRRRDLAMDSGSDQIYRFQIAAFKIIRGGHYILGPRSQSVTAGKVKAIAERTHSGGSHHSDSSALLLSCMLLFFVTHHWFQAR
ncbi:LOW QUALITY PROTEIN: contactin-6-like [Acropora millepora]|uniref:LOW QUALITY PROTEIN: contactin-6-like n=1 Tax=Acropora millepora TaxID=45264 RepID=UPI001CF5588C|nr:LOW QUALITY PROTEIN: contactin-6-like [Acropora millepora]